MSDICGDNRFEIIEAYKKKLIADTNIESRPDEMAVIDNILLRFWQMGWLPDITNTNAGDMISRQATIEKFVMTAPQMSIIHIYEAVEILESMPSAEPRMKGRWVYDGYDFPGGVDWIHCSECGKRGINAPADLSNYCPNCGADMRGKQNEKAYKGEEK